jgi:hypothetical protein
MATKRQPSKQKRAAQNRNERAARAARAANANAARTTTSPATGSGSSGSLLSRLRGGGTSSPRTGAATATARTRGSALRPDQPPGYRAALSALLAAVAAVLLCTFALRQPVDAQGDPYTTATRAADFSITAVRAAGEEPDATAAEVADSIDDWSPGAKSATVVQALWPFSLAILLPLLGAGLGFNAVRKRATSKIVNRALYATLFGAVLAQGLLILFLPVVLALGVAMFQVRKAEMIAAASAGPEGVIDVDEVDGDDDDEVVDDDEDLELDEDGAAPER